MARGNGKANLTLADKVYEMGVTQTLNGLKVPVDKIDTFCKKHENHRGGTTTAWFRSLQQDMIRAEKFVLDDDFVRLAIQQCANKFHVSRIAKHLRLARNPFSLTWLEWNSRVMREERLRLGMSVSDVAEPYRVGYLIRSTSEDGSVYNSEEFTILEPHEPVMCFPYKIYVNTEGPSYQPPVRFKPDGTRLEFNTALHRTAYLFGPTLSMYDTWEKGSFFPALFDQIALDMNDLVYNFKFGPGVEDLQSSFDNEISDANGIGGFMLAALALINEAEIKYHYVMQPSGRRFSHGKTLPYMTHRTVTIEVPGGVKNVTRYFDNLLKRAEIKHRAHQVRGFWRTLNKNTRQEKKVWVKPHVRGDASLGWVDQEHIVTTPEPDRV